MKTIIRIAIAITLFGLGLLLGNYTSTRKVKKDELIRDIYISGTILKGLRNDDIKSIRLLAKSIALGSYMDLENIDIRKELAQKILLHEYYHVILEECEKEKLESADEVRPCFLQSTEPTP
jgi:hypothetical protein